MLAQGTQGSKAFHQCPWPAEKTSYLRPKWIKDPGALVWSRGVTGAQKVVAHSQGAKAGVRRNSLCHMLLVSLQKFAG